MIDEIQILKKTPLWEEVEEKAFVTVFQGFYREL
jgi:hypothetical protein